LCVETMNVNARRAAGEEHQDRRREPALAPGDHAGQGPTTEDAEDAEVVGLSFLEQAPAIPLPCVARDSRCKLLEIHEGFLEILDDSVVVNIPIEMYEAVSEPCHGSKPFGEDRIQNAAFAEDSEAVGVVSRKTIAFRGNHMVGDIDRALDGDHEMIFRVADLVRIVEKLLLWHGRKPT
jgi:hypothetical protein